MTLYKYIGAKIIKKCEGSEKTLKLSIKLLLPPSNVLNGEYKENLINTVAESSIVITQNQFIINNCPTLPITLVSQ